LVSPLVCKPLTGPTVGPQQYVDINILNPGQSLNHAFPIGFKEAATHPKKMQTDLPIISPKKRTINKRSPNALNAAQPTRPFRERLPAEGA
jgi:hypothetical protein